MEKFKVLCDPNAREFCSTKIIVDEANAAAKKMGLYDDNGSIVMYDTMCQDFGQNPKALWCAFELPFARIVLDNAKGRPIFGLSKDNITFGAYADYPPNLLDYATLGVNREHWPLVSKKYMKDKFVFVSMCESNTRSGFDILVPAFGEQFRGNKGVVLYIKDREATPKFKEWVKEQAEKYDVSIVHDDRHIANYEEQVKIFEHADAAICLNRSHTFGMVVMQGMSCGLPTACQRYSGFTDYTSELTNVCIDFDVVKISQFKINQLVEIGMKNHLFPINFSYYNTEAFWSEPRKESVKLKMQALVDDKNLRDRMRQMSNLVASWFTWERTAVNLSYILSKYPNK